MTWDRLWDVSKMSIELLPWESGEKDASSGRLLELRWPVKVCSVAPVKASIRRMSDPFVEMRIVLPSGLNLRPVQSTSFSAESERELMFSCNNRLKGKWFHKCLNTSSSLCL